MASNLRKMTQPTQWKPQARRRATLLAIYSGPLALALVLLLGLATFASFGKVPKPVDTYAAITETTRVQNFARNALLLWLGGTVTSEKPLLARSSAAQTISLSETPFEVRSIDPSDIERFPGTDAVQWRVTLSATLVAPGSPTPQVNRFAVTVLDRDGDFQLLTWPYIVNIATTEFKVASRYTVPVDRTGPLGQSLDRFATAYLTSTGNATSLGQYTSAEFSGAAIAGSPFTTAAIEEIRAMEGSVPLNTAKPGDRISVLVRVKASASLQTWSVMDFPLRMSLSANDVWLVDGFDSPVRWGNLTGT